MKQKAINKQGRDPDFLEIGVPTQGSRSKTEPKRALPQISRKSVSARWRTKQHKANKGPDPDFLVIGLFKEAQRLTNEEMCTSA